MVNASQRGLTKPKSKIRLRLGLTPPHPKPVPAQTTSEKVITSTAISTATASATQVSPPVSCGQLAKSHSKSIVTSSTYSVASPGTGGINSLNASTSTSTSARTSNASPDSRSAFTYDNTSPSSLNHDTHEAHTGHTYTHTTTRSHTRTHTGTGLTFDTISYASASPISVHYAAHNRSTATLVSSLHEHGPLETSLYPTPSASSLSDEDYLDDIQAHAQATALARADHNAHAHGHDNAYGHGYVQDLATAAGESYPGITAATKADAVFMITDQQLSDRFSFEKEIGFGNWGSVWLCKLRRVRSELSMPQSHGYEVRLGRAAALSGGGGAGGKVAIKLVHRNQDPVSCTAPVELNLVHIDSPIGV
jgi:protein-serine/threonine kinase